MTTIYSKSTLIYDPREKVVVRRRGWPGSTRADKSVVEVFSYCNNRGGAKNGIHLTYRSEGHPIGKCFVELEDMEKIIKVRKSSNVEIKNVSKPKLKPFMSTRPGPYDRPPGGLEGGQRQFEVAVARGRRRIWIGYPGRSCTIQFIVDFASHKDTQAAMLKNKQSMEGGDESDANRFLEFSAGGGVPDKPTGHAVDTETIYKMSRTPRGIAVIINNKNFLRSSGMDKSPRNGTDVDRDALEKLFKYLNFEVRIYNDVTTDGIWRIAQEMAALTDHSAYDAFIFSILTHGEEGVLYGTDGTISTRDITSKFKDATTLAGKPKMFFFQACQGGRFMDGVDVPDGPESEASSKVSVPAEADFLYAYSTVPGYCSLRNSIKGSWFIQSLTKVFEEKAEHMDILRMLTRVNAGVSTYKSRTGQKGSDDKRQVPSVVSMLLKDLYFFPEKVTEQN